MPRGMSKSGKRQKHPVDITGLKYGNLTAIRDGGRNRHSQLQWEFLCDCGQTCFKPRGSVLSGNTKSCGCLATKSRTNHSRWRGVGELSRTHWSHICYNAKHNNIKVSVTIEDVWDIYVQQGGKCALTKLPIQFASTTGGKGWCDTTTASLDRVDSSKGYEPGNVQWLHKDVNFAKRTLTTERFIEMCRLVVENAK